MDGTNVTPEINQDTTAPVPTPTEYESQNVHNEQLSTDMDVMEQIAEAQSEAVAHSVNDEMTTESLVPVSEDDMEDVEDYITGIEKAGASFLQKESKVTKATNKQKRRAFDTYDGEVFNPEGYYDNVETDADKREKTYLELVSSKNGGKVLEGQITGVEIYENIGQVVALAQYKEFTVIIPATELIWIEQNTFSNADDIVLVMFCAAMYGVIAFALSSAFAG